MKASVVSLLTAFIFMPIFLIGCGDNEISEVKAANERIRVLENNLRTLEQENERLQVTMEGRTEELKSFYDDRIRQLRNDHRLKVADLESKLSEYRMNLSLSEKERIALQEVIDHPERLNEIQRNNFGIERVIWIVLVFIFIGASGFYASKYYYDKPRRENIVRLVSALSQKRGLNHVE